MKPRINAARSLAEEIGRIGALDRRRSLGRAPGESQESLDESVSETGISHGGAVPVSPPNHLSGRLLKVIVSDQAAKEDLGELSTDVPCRRLLTIFSGQIRRVETKSSRSLR